MKDTKEKILETAFALMVENGYNGVSIADITNDLGLARSLPYRYFKSKRDLFYETFKLYFFDRYFPPKYDYEKMSFREFLDISLRNMGDILENFPKRQNKQISVFDYNALYFNALKYEPRFRKYVAKEMFAMRPILERARKSGELSKSVKTEWIERALLDILSRCDNIQKKLSNAENLELIYADAREFYNLVATPKHSRIKKPADNT